MRKVFFVSLVAVLAAALGEAATAGDTEQDKEKNGPQLKSVQLNDPAAGGAIATEREWEYLAALQKCEVLDDAEKIKCVDVVREKYSEM